MVLAQVRSSLVLAGGSTVSYTHLASVVQDIEKLFHRNLFSAYIDERSHYRQPFPEKHGAVSYTHLNWILPGQEPSWKLPSIVAITSLAHGFNV